MKPIAIDLFTGLHGWAEGLAAEGWDVIGFDIKDMCAEFGRPRPAGVRLVLQDVLTIHGSQFKSAHLIVASPPCQNYSYLAMPWSRSPDFARPCGDGWEVLNSSAAKEMREEWTREGPDNRLFDACFRIQREAIEATRKKCPSCRGMIIIHPMGFEFSPLCQVCGGAGSVTRFIPLIVENVRGANEWVSPKSRYNYGSFHLWGDVPAIMPIQRSGRKNNGGSWFNIGSPGQTVTNQNPVHELAGQKTQGGSWFRERNGIPQPGIRHEDRGDEGTKIGGDWFSDPKSTCRKHGSRSKARKAASAQIAKIPPPLAEHIARVFKPAPHPQK